MNRIFENVRMKQPKMSAFDLSHDRKMSFNMGKLYPCFYEEVLPGDEFKVKSDALIKLAPMVAPIMHNIDAYIHYFFVPNRILWDQWEEFITGGEEGSAVVTTPKVEYKSTTGGVGSLADYFGVPTRTNGDTIGLNALPFKAYVEIYNEYYRDQNLTDRIDHDAASWYDTDWSNILTRAWEKDYFTSALPWAQRGPQVEIPTQFEYKDRSDVVSTDNVNLGANNSLQTDLDGTTSGLETSTGIYARIENLENDSLNISIQELRRSSRLQEFFEKAARVGARYKEQLLGYFGVNNGDGRLDRPEYLGGGRQPVVISEVLNTSATATEPQGNMAGHGISVGSSASFRRRFTEHGQVVGIISVRPKTTYFQGVDRRFIRDDRFDYFWPEFAHLGEQEVKEHEIYQDPAFSILNEATFGYQQRYAEYKHKQCSVHGDFKDSLKYWHEAREFSVTPNLNTTFVECNPSERVFAVQDSTDKLYAHIYHDFGARRPIPYFSDPKL